MRVLFITNYYPPYEVGGYEQLCRDVAIRLAERGHEAQILTSNRGINKYSQVGETNVHRVLHLQPNFKSQISPALQFFLMRCRVEVHNRGCLRALAEQFVPDVIFIWNLQRIPRTIALEAESMPNVAVAYWLAGYSPAEPDEFLLYWTKPTPRSVRGVIKSLLRKLAMHIMRSEGKPLRPKMRNIAVVSEYMRCKGITDGTLPVHTQVIYNGVEIEQFLRPVCTEVRGPLRLLQAGRVSEDKGVHTAIEAVGHLAHTYQALDVHLDVVGSGPAAYLAHLQQLISQYDIGDKVTLLGWVPRADMAKLMAKCHVLLLPSIHPEAFARVVLEAMASGLAVIGTPTGGTGELLQHESTGLTFSPGDSQDLAKQIQRLLSDPSLRQRLAAEGQRMILERFTLEHMVGNIERFLEEVCISQGKGSYYE